MSDKEIPILPGPPLIGHLRDFRHARLNLYLRAYHICGDIGQYRVGPWRIIQINAPEYIQAVLVDHAACFETAPVLQKYLRPLLGNGLLTSEGGTYRRQRKLIAPAFQHRRIATYAPVMTTAAEQLAQQWTDGATIDLATEMMQLTLSIVGKTLFDADVLHEASDVGAALTTVMSYANDQMSALAPLPLTWPTPRNRRVQRALARLDTTIYRIIQERRAAGADRGDLLSILLRLKDEDDGTQMSDTQVRDEAMTLFLAGHETTATALAWTWYLLAQHPASYARVRDEVDQVLGRRTPTATDLPKLPYTLQVFKEALRLYPPAYVIPRQVVQALQVGPYCLPVGALVAISPYVLHRRPDYFPDPERFDPDRWTAEAEQRLPRHAYLPFSAGPRICIGNHFALLEGHLVLATLAQHVTFGLVSNQQIEPEPLITLRPKGGMRVIVRRRAAPPNGSTGFHPAITQDAITSSSI